MIDIQRADPIFIHGILPRSGTNFLWDLLLLHPDCARAREPVNEDLFLDHSDHLVAFVEAVRALWDPRWGTFGPDLPERLLRRHRRGLVSFLWTDRQSPAGDQVAERSATWIVSFSFFPSARLADSGA